MGCDLFARCGRSSMQRDGMGVIYDWARHPRFSGGRDRRKEKRGVKNNTAMRIAGKILFVLACFVAIMWAAVYTTEAISTRTVTLPLDCHSSAIQSGVPVKRLSDNQIARIDVCGAADSSDDEFRDIK